MKASRMAKARFADGRMNRGIGAPLDPERHAEGGIFNLSRRTSFAIVLVILIAGSVYGQEVERSFSASESTVPLTVDALRQKGANLSPPLSSLLVSQNGKLLIEAYYGGMRRNEAVNIKSASKSIVSALVGIALRQGHLKSVDQTVESYFPEYIPATSPKRRVTLHHLLSMHACLETTSFYNYGEWIAHSNWVRAALDQPLVCEPGSEMIYSTGNSHVVAVLLEKNTPGSLLAYAVEQLFDPLGMAKPGWDKSPAGYYFGGNNMALRPIDLIRFGEMYLRGGTTAEGDTVVNGDWIARSWYPYGRSHYSNHQHGYFWWIDVYAGYYVYFAWGYGGQYVFVIPALEGVVVMTSRVDQYQRGTGHNAAIQRLLETSVIPYLQGAMSPVSGAE